MSSPLADIIARVIELAQDERGTIDLHRGISLAVPLIREDDEALEAAIREAAAKRIKDAATAARRAAEKADERQMFFAGLRPRYALDTEGRTIKRTDELSRLEYERIIQIRRHQIAADQEHLEQLVGALDAVRALWDRYPDRTFGEIKAMFLRRDAA